MAIPNKRCRYRLYIENRKAKIRFRLPPNPWEINLEKPITKTFTITASPRLIKRIERFFALIHFSSNWGHSGLFGMYVDGDGPDCINVEPLDKTLRSGVDRVTGWGFGVEIAGDGGFYGAHLEKNDGRRLPFFDDDGKERKVS